MTEVEPVVQQPCALGVLFVHGMGSHAPGSTLREFAEPLVGWMKTAGVGIDDVQLERAQLDGAGDAPGHVTCVLKSSENEESTWLLAETCWSESFEPPSYLKISFWLISSVPWMLGDYMRAAIVRENERPTLKLLRPFRWLLIVLYAALGALLAGPIVLLLTALLVGQLIPIERVKKVADKVPRLLAASLGDVYVILATHLDRAAIRDQILRDHLWLKARCDTTVVVAHSAGSALTHQLIRDDRMTGVKTYITLGEAIWRMRWMAKLSAKGAWRMLGIGLAVTGTALIAGGWAVLALELVGSSERWGALALVVGVVLHAVSAYVVWMGSDTKAERLEAVDVLSDKGVTWRDYVASSDPVPAGALTERAHATRPAGRRARTADQSHYTPVGVRNRRSILRDHTSYVGNLEGFVAGLGIDLVNADVLPVPDVNGRLRPRLSLRIDETKLKPWREARAERTLSRALMRFCSALVGLVVLGALTTTDGALASVGGEDGWLQDALDWPSTALENVLPEDWFTLDRLGLAVALALLVASWLAAGLACRIWDGADRKRFLAFEKPSKDPPEDPSTDQDRLMAALRHPWPHVAAAVWWALVSAAAAFGLLAMAEVDDTLWWLAAAAALAVGVLLLALVRAVKKARDLVYSSPADGEPANACCSSCTCDCPCCTPSPTAAPGQSSEGGEPPVVSPAS